MSEPKTTPDLPAIETRPYAWQTEKAMHHILTGEAVGYVTLKGVGTVLACAGNCIPMMNGDEAIHLAKRIAVARLRATADEIEATL